MLQSRVEQLDLLIAEFIELNPFQQTVEVITSIMDNKPVIRRDKGRDFVEFTIESLASDYARNRIGHSRYENGKSGMNIFREFLRSTKRGTYRPDSIYVGEITPDLLESYIEWRRDVKQNSDPTINHALTPILKAYAYAKNLGYIDADINARIQDMRIVTKVSLSDEEAEFDGKSLTTDQMKDLLKYYDTCQEPRRKECYLRAIQKHNEKFLANLNNSKGVWLSKKVFWWSAGIAYGLSLLGLLAVGITIK